jgi:hypothetical protein
VVTQRTANPRTPVQFRAWPPISQPKSTRNRNHFGAASDDAILPVEAAFPGGYPYLHIVKSLPSVCHLVEISVWQPAGDNVGKRYLLALAVLAASSTWAHAYLDPGTGSFVLQLIIGGAIAAAATIRFYWARTKEIARRLLGSKVEPPGS